MIRGISIYDILGPANGSHVVAGMMQGKLRQNW